MSGPISFRRAPRCPGDPPDLQRYLGWEIGNASQLISIIYQPDNNVVAAHVSACVWDVVEDSEKWARLPTDAEMKAILWGIAPGRKWEEDNVGTSGKARHFWETK